MLWPFNTASHVVVTPAMTLFHCYLIAVMLLLSSVEMLIVLKVGFCQRGRDSQVENPCCNASLFSSFQNEAQSYLNRILCVVKAHSFPAPQQNVVKRYFALLLNFCAAFIVREDTAWADLVFNFWSSTLSPINPDYFHFYNSVIGLWYLEAKSLGFSFFEIFTYSLHFLVKLKTRFQFTYVWRTLLRFWWIQKSGGSGLLSLVITF